MSRSKTTIGYGKSPRARIIRIAPITHAVRLALAASATVFALAGSGAALAQTCTSEANNTVYCDGAFVEPVAYENVNDLTLVLGANSPTSVTVTGENVGVFVSGTGNLGIVNDADVSVYSLGAADGLAVLSPYGYEAGVLELTNSGNVVVEALADASGMYASGGVADIANSGTLSSTTQDGGAFGIYVRSLVAMVTNSGSIVSTSQSGAAEGMYVFSRMGEVTNSGSITASSEEGFTIGIHAEGVQTMVSNTATGTIDVTGYLDTTGIQAAGDIVVVDNAGLIEAAGGAGSYSTLGVIATGQSLASVDNTGRVEASGSPRTIAIYADANATGPEAIARVSNAGDVIATSSSTFSIAAGIAGISADGVEVTNTGSIQANSQSQAIGIYAYGDDLVVVNAGTIAANGLDSQEYHSGRVSGIVAFAPFEDAGRIEITTLEGSSITAESLTYLAGIIASGGDEIRIDNAGDISLVDDFDPDSGVPFGFADSSGIYAVSGAEGVRIDIDNSGEITVDVTIGDATGINVGVGGEGSNIDIANDGGIDVYSDGVRRSITAASVYGVRARGPGDATVVNNGDIDVGIGFGTVFGIRVDTAGDAAVRNDGTITVTGGNVGPYAYDNFGISVQSPDAGIQVDNAGELAVTAAGSGDYGNNAIGIFADGGEVMVTNTGSITTYSRIGTSVGVATQGDVLTVVNHGDILATTATADPYNAIGVQMDATTSATFNNTGTITTTTANGVGSGVAVLIESDGAINFNNTGTLLGAVITRDGDDAVTGRAGSAWMLTRQTTDLGAGDDRIRNLFGSTLDLDSGRIVLGEGRNSFVNYGLIRVRGDSLVDMGVDTRFGLALVNNGVIELGSSVVDRLTVAGDLGGRGVIHLGHGNGAWGGQLVVDGSVRPGSVQTVNVEFAGFDAIRQHARTDFAFVQRDSTAGSFVGGEVLGFEAGNFLKLGVDVDSWIDTSNQRDDVFSASVHAEGLDDSGRLAASLGAGAQSLLAAQIGTWRQRSGVLPAHSPDRSMTGFFRSFGDQSEISPMYTGNAGQRSDFGFGQRNAGAEMGMHYQPAVGFSMGMRVGKSEGQQTLTGAGHGLNWIHADTFGVYGTWLSPKGLYVDASVWQMDFDSRMQSSGSHHAVRGDASAVSVETGYAFKLPSGLRVEPSLQYTWTRMGGLSLQGSQAEFRSEAGDWRRARAGVLAWKPIRGGSGITWTPYGSISVVRTDTSGAGYTVSDVFNGGTSMDGANTMLELGLGLRQRGVSANAGLNWTRGDTVGNSLGGQVLLHYGW